MRKNTCCHISYHRSNRGCDVVSRSIVWCRKMAMSFSLKWIQRSFSTSPVKIRYTHLPTSTTLPSISSTISPVFSASGSDTKQLFKLKKREYIEKYQSHQLDVGSSQVQVAILTEKIRLLGIHLQENKKDKSAFRGFNVCDSPLPSHKPSLYLPLLLLSHYRRL